jgi:hypothetical protein
MATNTVPTPPRKDSLQQLEESLSRSLHFFSPRSSLEGLAPEPVLPPPPVQVIPNRRALQEQERRKNWMALTPEELMQGPHSELFKSSEPGADNDNKSALEHFYDRLNWEHPARKQPAPKEDNRAGSRLRPGSSGDLFGSPDAAEIPAGLRESTKKLKEEVGSDKRRSFFDPVPQHSGFADFFGFGDKTLSPEDIKAHKEYMEQYRQLLQGPAPAANPLAPPGPAAAPLQPGPYNGFNSFASTPTHRLWGASPDGYNPGLNPGKLQDFNATVLNQWNPLYSPPKPEPPKPAPMFVPPAEAPRRKFF